MGEEDARAIYYEVVHGNRLDTSGDGGESAGGCDFEEAGVLFFLAKVRKSREAFTYNTERYHHSDKRQIPNPPSNSRLGTLRYPGA